MARLINQFFKENMDYMMKAYLVPSLSSFWGGGPSVVHINILKDSKIVMHPWLP